MLVSRNSQRQVSASQARGKIDAGKSAKQVVQALVALLNGHGGLRVVVEKLADADWLAMALSGLPSVKAA